MANITPILNSTQIALEKVASDKFGAAVEDFSSTVLGPALGVPVPGPNASVNRNDGSFYATSYAHALAGGTGYRPKLKFLFKVEFIFTVAAKKAFPGVFDSTSSNDFTFMVKSVDRPKIDFEYEDDINMYNFRTKVLKKIRHRELTITFMDDTGNQVLKFFRALMMLHSPITRRQMLREGTNKAPTIDPVIGNGMMFNPVLSTGKEDTAIRGVINSSVGNAIETIRVKQFFVDSGAKLGAATKEVIFDFLNARLVSFDLDDLSHDTSDVNIMTMQFDYDWMEIVDCGVMTTTDKAGTVVPGTDSPHYNNIAVAGVHGAPVDITVYDKGPMDSGGAGNPFMNIITNQIGRAGQQITSEAINRGVASIAGKGRFASLIGSQASNILGSTIGAAARGLLTTGVNQASVRPTTVDIIAPGASNVIKPDNNSLKFSTGVMDSAEGGPAPIIGITRSDDGEA